MSKTEEAVNRARDRMKKHLVEKAGMKPSDAERKSSELARRNEKDIRKHLER